MTSSISNPVNIITALNSGAAGAKQSGPTPGVQFDQMLSRGIEQRRSQSEPDKPGPKASTPLKPAAQPAQPPAKADKANSAAEAQAEPGTETSSAPVAEDASAPVEHGKAKPDPDAKDDSEEAIAAAGTGADELLALVANLAQVSTVTTPVADQAANDGEQAVAADGANPTPSAAASVMTMALPVDASPATALPVVEGKSDVAALALPAGMRNQPTSNAASSSVETAAPSQFDTSLAEAKDKKAAADMTAKAGLVQPQPDENGLPGAQPTGAESRAAKAAVEAQPIAAPVVSAAFAPQSPVSHQQVQAAAATAAAADKLAPRVGSNGWDQALGQKIVWMVGGEMQSASLTLNPPDLGPMEVVLNVSNNQANVTFTAAQPEVRQALEDAVPKLREMLGDAGIQLGQANVSAGTPNNQPGQHGESRQSTRSTGDSLNKAEETTASVMRSQAVSGGGNGLVDTFA
jgi:flagellar hook-length control protein FliK